MAAQPQTSVIATDDGEHLHYQRWQAPGEVRAGLLIVHGIGEHCDRYGEVVEALTPRGIVVHGWDQRGHGRSTGRRGHVDSWRDYRRDLVRCLEEARVWHGRDQPLFVLGHSMGSLVALDAVLQERLELRGLVISGVPMEPAGVAKAPLVWAAKLLSRVWPTCGMVLPLKPEQLTSDGAKLEALAGDGLLHGRATARWGAEALAAVARVRQRAGEIDVPLLVIHGALDSVNRVAGAEWLFEHVASADKQLRVYSRSRHEPHNDVESETVMRDLVEWVEGRLDGTRG